MSSFSADLRLGLKKTFVPSCRRGRGRAAWSLGRRRLLVRLAALDAPSAQTPPPGWAAYLTAHHDADNIQIGGLRDRQKAAVFAVQHCQCCTIETREPSGPTWSEAGIESGRAGAACRGSGKGVPLPQKPCCLPYRACCRGLRVRPRSRSCGVVEATDDHNAMEV